MSVDVIQQLANGIKILLDSSNELEDKVNRSVNHQKMKSNLCTFLSPSLTPSSLILISAQHQKTKSNLCTFFSLQCLLTVRDDIPLFVDMVANFLFFNKLKFLYNQPRPIGQRN
jgi:hypothetical protein